MAVISLSALGDNEGKKISVGKIVLDIIKNLLILGIAAALICVAMRPVLSNFGITFRLSNITPLFKMLQYLADLAIHLALLVQCFILQATF